MRLSQEQQRAVEAAAIRVGAVNQEVIRAASGSAPTPPAKRNKYGNKKVFTAEGKFDSQHEWEYWCYLKLRQRTGEIVNLRRQVPFKLRSQSGVVITKYVADFTFVERGQLVVVDAKGMRTRAYIQKRKWMRADHGIDIIEV
jgi:hypothetical protein